MNRIQQRPPAPRRRRGGRGASFQRRYSAQPSGCARAFSFVLVTFVVVGAGAFGWSWLNRRANLPPPTENVGDRLAQAAAAFRNGDLDTAIAAARAHLAAVPESDPALVLLIRALVYRSYSEYNRAPDRRAALLTSENALETDEHSADRLAAYAFALQSEGQPGASADAARRALESNPEHRLARVALALAYAVAGSPEIAQRESLLAAEGAQGDDAVDALRALAISYGDQGDYARAAQTVDAAIRLHPGLTTLYFERAGYAMLMGDTDGATVAYYAVLSLSPENVKARYRLCEVSSILREREAAVTYCQGVLSRAPGWADGWFLLGREYFLSGDFAQASDHLHQCARLQIAQNVPISERRIDCWLLQGQAAQLAGDCDRVRSAYAEFMAMKAAAPDVVVQTWALGGGC